MWGASTIGRVLTVQALAPVCGSLASTHELGIVVCTCTQRLCGGRDRTAGDCWPDSLPEKW